MTYSLQFEKRALKEWRKLAPPIRDQFKAKLQERLNNPHVPAAKLRGSKDRYKIKLKASGYRMVYQVEDNTITLLVIAIGKRDGNDVLNVSKCREYPLVIDELDSRQTGSWEENERMRVYDGPLAGESVYIF